MPVVFRTVFYPHVQSVVEVVVAKNKHDDKNQLRVQQPAKMFTHSCQSNKYSHVPLFILLFCLKIIT